MMSKEAKAARAAYMREWRKRNPEKKKQYEEAQWERKARKIKEEQNKKEEKKCVFIRDDFFESEFIKDIESKENGYVFTNILFKLFVLYAKTDGKILVNEYQIQELFNIDKKLAKKAFDLFSDLSFFDKTEDGFLVLKPNEYIKIGDDLDG